MTISRRVSIQWPPGAADETTNTMVFTSKKNRFVDVRIKAKYYPLTEDTDLAFDEVFDWCMTGTEIPEENSDKITFDHEIDSHEISKSIKTGKDLTECRSSPDVGYFSSIENSTDRKETGKMENPDIGVMSEYIEIWRSLDAAFHTPENECKESARSEEPAQFVLELTDKEAIGTLIRLGNWCQGVVYNPSANCGPLSVLRVYYNHLTQKWEYIIKFGQFEFPIKSIPNRGDEISLDGYSWHCTESLNL